MLKLEYPGETGQYHGWCLGFLCCQTISNHGIDNKHRQKGQFFHEKEFNYLGHLNDEKWHNKWKLFILKNVPLSAHLYDLACLRNNSRNIFQIFLKRGWNILLVNITNEFYDGIAVTSTFFAFMKSFFFLVRTLKFHTVGPFTCLLARYKWSALRNSNICIFDEFKNFASMNGLVHTLTDEVLFQSFWNSTGILLIWRIGGGGHSPQMVCVCVWGGAGWGVALTSICWWGKRALAYTYIHTYIEGGGGTHLWCIYYLVPYSDLGGQGELQRLTSLLYIQQHPQPSGHCGRCLLLVIIVIMCNICKFSNFVSEPMGWQYYHATWF